VTISYIADTTQAFNSSPSTLTYQSASTDDLLAFFVSAKASSRTTTAPGTFTDHGTTTGGTGSAGADTGSVRLYFWSRTVDGSEPASDSLTWSATPSPTIQSCVQFRKTNAGAWSIGYAFADDSSQSTGTDAIDATAATDPGFAVGDMVAVVFASPTDQGTYSNPDIIIPSVTLGSVSNPVTLATTTGNDGTLKVWTALVTAGTSSGNPQFQCDVTDANASAGPVLFVRLREPAGGATYAAAGTSAAVAAESLAVTAILVASGTTAAVAAAALTVTSLLPSAGISPVTAASTGTVTALLPASGTTAATVTTSLAATPPMSAAGTSAATAATSLTATALLPAAGTSAAAAASSLAVTSLLPASGTSAATVTSSLAATPPMSASGTIAASAATSLDIAALRPVTGSTDATTTASLDAELLPGDLLSASGTAAATATTELTVGVMHAVSGQVDTIADMALTVAALLTTAGQADVVADASLAVTARLTITGTVTALCAVALAVIRAGADDITATVAGPYAAATITVTRVTGNPLRVTRSAI
jgi:hypothetical protein